MTSATTNTPQPGDSAPSTIYVYPSQRLEQLPVAALVAFVPQLRTTYRVVTRRNKTQIATSRTHYRLKLATGSTVHISDNLLDLLRLIDGRRNIQAISDALAEQQGRPVHPAEIVHLLRHRLAPAGLVELTFPPALPEPRRTKPLGATIFKAGDTQEKTPSTTQGNELAGTPVPPTRQDLAHPQHAAAEIQWIPPGKRAERLRTTRRQPPLRQRSRRTSHMSLIATFLIVLAAGGAFAFGHASFSHASFTLPSLSAFFGGITPTATIGPTPTATPTPPPHPIYYVVQDGDTLDKIAARFHVTTQALVIVNHLSSPAAITTDQVLHIPTVYHPGANIALLAHPIFYVVQQGDSISSIAALFGTNADTLIHYNHIPANKASLIHPGDSLVIP